MKKLFIVAITMITFNTSAQQVELGVNAGNISSVSVGLSTWKWLYIGVSYEFTSLGYSPLNTAPKNREYNFYSPMIYLQPTIKVSDKVNFYGAYHLGYYYDVYVGNGQTVNDYILSLGVNVKVLKALYINGEMGYFHINQNVPWIAANESGYETSRDYIAVGVKYLLNSRPKQKSKEPTKATL